MTAGGSILQFTKEGLILARFQGFVSVQTLLATKLKDVPKEPGVYVVLRESDVAPTFLNTNPGGWFNGDPTVSHTELRFNWVRAAHVIYIGKGAGAEGIKQRLRQFLRFGSGHVVGHWGGRYVWQIERASDFVIAWKIVESGQNARDVELQLFDDFERIYGTLPFANLTR
jgi:hypothetical protein